MIDLRVYIYIIPVSMIYGTYNKRVVELVAGLYKPTLNVWGDHEHMSFFANDIA